MASPGRPYDERGYRAAKAAIEAERPPCWRGCGRVATSPDHVPPLDAHDHQAGSGCCALLPACLPCQAAHGARLGNSRRARMARTYAVRRW